MSVGGGPHLQRSRIRRWIVSHAREEAYLPRTRSILARMGYAVVPAEDWDALPPEQAARAPDLRIVDERRLAELDDESEDGIPTLVLTGRHGVTGADPRVLGAARKPVGLHELYRLLQQALEDVPRSTPRVPTHLPARCRSRHREWRGAVVSLSENGCLLRSPEPVRLGSELEIAFELPRVGRVETKAESAYQVVPDLGLVFHETPAGLRHAISDFVENALSVF
jgi:hypothetical protein